MTKSKLLTALMIAKRNHAFLATAIDGLLQQTFSDHLLLIVHDSSNNRLSEILYNYQAREPTRIRILENRGFSLADAFNYGLSQVSTPYTAQVDCSSVSHCTRFAIQLTILNRTPEIGLVGTQSQLIDENGNLIAGTETRYPLQHKIITHQIEKRFRAICNSSVMFRTDLMIKTGGYNRIDEYSQNNQHWLQISKRSQIANLPNILVYNRIRNVPIL
ncbi:MAG: glycosyltransferase [Labrys sp. (in: a-proteobacteria)]